MVEFVPNESQILGLTLCRFLECFPIKWINKASTSDKEKPHVPLSGLITELIWRFYGNGFREFIRSELWTTSSRVT